MILLQLELISSACRFLARVADTAASADLTPIVRIALAAALAYAALYTLDVRVCYILHVAAQLITLGHAAFRS